MAHSRLVCGYRRYGMSNESPVFPSKKRQQKHEIRLSVRQYSIEGGV
ncbi:MAG: hypothetical protein MI923_17160 [Phycisphaerales bacterium]|nr:hypothetical protein [Phycisphaerales bacterium]